MGISFFLRESFAKRKVWRGKVESDVENVKKSSSKQRKCEIIRRIFMDYANCISGNNRLYC